MFSRGALDNLFQPIILALFLSIHSYVENGLKRSVLD